MSQADGGYVHDDVRGGGGQYKEVMLKKMSDCRGGKKTAQINGMDFRN